VVLVGPLWIRFVRGVWSFCYLVKELRGRFVGERIRKKGWRTERGVKDGDDMMQLARTVRAKLRLEKLIRSLSYCIIASCHRMGS
jgi:hypothetical protein